MIQPSTQMNPRLNRLALRPGKLIQWNLCDPATVAAELIGIIQIHSSRHLGEAVYSKSVMTGTQSKQGAQGRRFHPIARNHNVSTGLKIEQRI
tara:strand:- start:5244 stop:5522 length:279 start_codon:yes stop_codon:yes gene_type:complete